jgi:hypothetical protein
MEMIRGMVTAFLLSFFVVLLAGLVFPREARGNNMSAPFVAAGKLRSLSQRQAKLYFQIRLGIESHTARQALNRTRGEFEQALVRIQDVAGSGSGARAVRRIGSGWETLRNSFEQVNPQIGLIAADAEQISVAAQSLAVQLEMDQESPYFRLADLASRSDMLAQRLARIYLQIRSEGGNKAAEVDLLQTSAEFVAAMRELEEAAETTPLIRRDLALVRQQWLFFELAIRERDRNIAHSHRDVATTSERISQMMDETMQRYLRLASEQGDVSAASRRR